MTAPLFNLPLPSSVAGAAPAGGGAASSPVEGFDALLAALFGGTAEPAVAGLFGEAKPAGEKNGQDAQAGETQTLTPNADAQALAAMLAAMPPAAAVTPPEAEAATGTAPTPTPAIDPEAVFAPVAPTAVATATNAAAASAAAQGADASGLETALAALPEADAATTEAVVAALTPKPATDQKVPQAAASTTPPVPAQAQSAPAAAPAPQAMAQAAQAPATDAVAQSMVQAEAVVDEAAPVAETPKERASARPTKLGENGRRGAAAAAPPPAPDANDPLTQGALAQTAAADGSGEPASAVEADPLAAADPKGGAETADAPDAQPPAPAAPAHLSAAAAEAAPVRATHETVANLAAQVVKKLDGHSTKFDVQLNPLGLGEVNVSVEIAANGKMTAAMSFETTHAAAELRGRSHELQRALEQAGFDVSGGLTFDVASERGGNGRSFAEQQQQQQHEGAAWRGRAFQALLDTAGGGADQAMANALYLQRRTTSGVDIRI
jgi:hypothetical protein